MRDFDRRNGVTLKKFICDAVLCVVLVVINLRVIVADIRGKR